MNLSGLGAVAGGYQDAQDKALARQVLQQRLSIEQQNQEIQQQQIQRQQQADSAMLQSYGGGSPLPGAQPMATPPQTGQQPMPGQPSVPMQQPGSQPPQMGAGGQPGPIPGAQPMPSGPTPPPQMGQPPGQPQAAQAGAQPQGDPNDPMVQFKRIGQQMADDIKRTVPQSATNPTLFAMLMNQKLEMLKQLQPMFKDQAEAVQNHIKNVIEQQRADETGRHNRVDEGQGNQRLGMEGQRLGIEQQKLKDAEGGGISDNPDDKKAVAAQIATGQPVNQVIPGYGKQAVADRKTAMADARAMIKEQNPGMTDEQAGEELANRSIEFQSGKKSQGQLTQMLGATKQAVGQLDYNIDQTKKDMKGLASSDLSPVLNAIARGEEKWTGDPAYSSLFYHMSATAVESARILSGGQASSAQLHQGAMEEAKKWANVNMTPASFDAVAKAMRGEGENRIQTYQQAIKSQRRGGRDDEAAPEADVAPKAGTVENGYKFKGGDPAKPESWEKQ